MSGDRSPNAPRRGRLLASAVGCAALLALLVNAGCGSDDNANTNTAAGGGSTAAAGGSEATANVSDADLQNTVNTALNTDTVQAATLPPLMRDALARATPAPDQATMDKAYACWQQNSCTVGDGELVLGLADGFGDNTWRKFSKMNVILQALTHPEVGKIIMTNASGQLPKFQSDIRSLTAQGAKAIVSYNDFGPAAYPAFTAAQRGGAAVSTYVGPGDGAPVTAITTRVQPDLCTAGKTMAQASKDAVGNAPVAYFSGTPGNPQDSAWQKCATEAGLNPVFKADTNWTPAGAQTAASALIASGKPAEAILYSYSNPVPNIVRTYNKANKPLPAIITWTQDNGTSCQWRRDKYPLYQTNALNWAARVSVDAVVNKANGQDVPDAVIYPMPFSQAKDSDCAAGKPADYPGTSALVPEQLVTKILGG